MSTSRKVGSWNKLSDNVHTQFMSNSSPALYVVWECYAYVIRQLHTATRVTLTVPVFFRQTLLIFRLKSKSGLLQEFVSAFMSVL